MAAQANTASTLEYHLKNDVHHMMAKNYISAVSRMDPPHYFFFGKNLPWNDVDDCPDLTSDYYADEAALRNNIVLLDRIRAAEVSHVIKRHDWEAGQVYDRWDPRISDQYPAYSGATEIFTSTMFVITPSNHIYKCIDNNDNSPCYDMPTSTTTDYITTADDYVWKYMMTVNEYSRLSFMNTDWVPVVNGVHSTDLSTGITVTIDDGGQDYDPTNTIIVVVGDGLGAHLKPIINGGVITGIEVVDPGEGYSYASAYVSTPDLTLPRGTGAQISVEFPLLDLGTTQVNTQLSAVDGDISSISITANGANYTSANVVISGNGSGATATAQIENGQVTKVHIVTRGSGYTYANISIVGDGFGAEAYAIVSPSAGHGHDIVEESRSRAVATKKNVNEVSLHGVVDWPNFRQCGIWTHPDKTPLSTEFRQHFTAFQATPCWGVNSEQIFKDDYTLNQLLIRQTDQTEWYVVARSDTKLVLQSLTGHSIEPADVFYDENGAYAFYADSVESPDVVKESGLIMFYDNNTVYHAIEDSAVRATIYIEF